MVKILAKKRGAKLPGVGCCPLAAVILFPGFIPFSDDGICRDGSVGGETAESKCSAAPPRSLMDFEKQMPT